MPPLFPERASTMAARVDALYFTLLGIAAFFSLLIAGLIVYYAVRYRRRTPTEIGASIHGGMILEITWTVVPLLITMVLFVWGASVYFAMSRAPDDTLNIYVVGKQWMWKFQHLDGQREINELHVPVGRDVKLIATSEDVIHDLFVPAFRVKADVLPGRYVSIWFHATRPGRYQIFCAEYCGTRHSGMTGQVVVMEPSDYQAWLSGGAPEGSLASAGEKLFQDLAANR
jgi:cytochrome c oxidase subunit 2